jgi:WD40 repeat protein
VSDAFAPGGTIASGGFDGKVRLWDRSTLRPRAKPLATGFPSPRLSFSDDAKQLLAASLGEAVLLRTDVLKTTMRITPRSNASTYSFAIASNGSVIAVGGSTVLRLPRNRRSVTLQGTGDVFNVAIHAEADQALLTTNSGTAVWDLRTGTRLTRLFPGNAATLRRTAP